MAEPFLGQISLFSFSFAPRGWAQCAGQTLAINQNQALFSLLGTTYGGDGRTTFMLPDLRGRVAASEGGGLTRGQRAGSEYHSLTVQEIPRHMHLLRASTANATTRAPNDALLASTPARIYSNASPGVALNAKTVTQTGASQPHENRQPYLVIGFCIALVGIFPSRE